MTRITVVLSCSTDLQVEQQLEAACNDRKLLGARIASLEHVAHSAEQGKVHAEAEATR